MLNRNNASDERSEDINDVEIRDQNSSEADESAELDILQDSIEKLEKNELNNLIIDGDWQIDESKVNRLCDAIVKGKENITEITYASDVITFLGFNHVGFNRTRNEINTQILKAFTLCQNLTCLDLSCTQINTEQAHLLAQIIRNNTQLSELILVDCSMSNPELMIIADLFAEEQFIINNQIESIDLSENDFDLESLKQLTTSLQNIKSIETLLLSNSNIDDLMMEPIAHIITNSKLKEISLSVNRITHVGVKQLCDALTLVRENNPAQTMPISLNLSLNPIGKRGILALAEFIENNGQLKALSLHIEEEDEIDDESILKFIAATNNNFNLQELVCLKSNGWSNAVMTAVSNLLKSNCSLTTINFDLWEENLIIDMLTYNFTLLNVNNWQEYNPQNDHQNNLAEFRLSKVDLSLAMNALLSQILHANVFANIDIANQVYQMMEMKQLILKDHIPKSLLAVFNSILIQDGLGQSIIMHTHPLVRKGILKAMYDVLRDAQTSEYQDTLSTFFKLYQLMVNTEKRNLATLNYLEDSILSLDIKASKLIKNGESEACELAERLQPGAQRPVVIPLIALQIPSLKDLCYHIVSLQIIGEQSHVILGNYKTMLPTDISGELDHIPRLLPHMSSPIYRGATFFYWDKINLGVQLLPCKPDEQVQNEDVDAAHANKKRSNSEPLFPRNFRLGNSKH